MQSLDDTLDKWILAFVLAALTIITALAIVVPFVKYNNLLCWDMAAHFYTAKFVSEHIFPWFTGWNPNHFAGFPLNHYYSPLFYWLCALLAPLTGLESSFKLLVALSVFAVPFAAAYCAVGFRFSWLESACFVLLVYLLLFQPDDFILWGDSPGATFSATFEVGQVANGFALPLFFLFLGSAARLSKTGSPVLSTLLLSLCLLSHQVVGIVVIVVAVAFLLEHRRDARSRNSFLKVLFFSFCLVAWWAVPFALRADFFVSAERALTHTQYLTLLFIAVIYLCFFAAKAEMGPAIRSVFTAGVFICLSSMLMSFHSMEFHHNRFNIYLALLGVIALVHGVSRLNDSRAWLFVLCFAALAGIRHSWLLIDSRGTSSLYFPQRRVVERPESSADYSGRAMLLTSFYGMRSLHAPNYLIPERLGLESLRGVFVEASANAPFISLFERSVNRHAFVWGLPRSVSNMGLINLGSRMDLIRPYLDLFGVNYLVSNYVPAFVDSSELQNLGEVANDSLDRFGKSSLGALRRLSRRSGFGFTFDLYHVNESPIVEIVQRKIVAIRGDLSQWRGEILKWFVDPLRVESSLLVYSPPEDPIPLGADETSSVRLLERSPSGDRFRMMIESSRPIPVLAKFSYFPKWHAFKNGREIPILIASPYLMLVNDTGEIEFVYGDRPLDVFSKLLLLFPLLGWTILLKNRLGRPQEQ